MNENPIERLCNSPQRWLIVTGVTFVIALVSVLPQVDQLLAERSERAELQEQIAQAAETAERLPVYEARVAEKNQELLGLRAQEVDESQLATLRSWLVGAARQSGCQVRRIDFAAATSRSWTNNDNPLETPSKPAAANSTPFQLQTRSVVFSVTGTTGEVLTLLRSIDSDPRLKNAHSLDLKPTNRSARELQLDLNLWYFALVKSTGVA